MMIIKTYVLATTFLFGLAGFSQSDTNGFWQTNYKQAMSEAKAQNKPVMLYFSGSDFRRSRASGKVIPAGTYPLSSSWAEV